MSDLAKHYAPLTGAEVALVMRRMAESGRPEAEVVAEVKSERVGPAATWDADFAARLAATPGPAPEPPAEVPEVDDDDPPLTLDDDLDLGEDETSVEDMWDEDQIREANAADLVDYIKAHPDLADLIAPIEAERENGGRKTVLDALDDVKEAR